MWGKYLIQNWVYVGKMYYKRTERNTIKLVGIA